MFEFWTRLIAFDDDARALSDRELAQLSNRMARQQQNACFNPYGLDNIYGLMNYRPPVFVPEGWAEWYCYGDELH